MRFQVLLLSTCLMGAVGCTPMEDSACEDLGLDGPSGPADQSSQPDLILGIDTAGGDVSTSLNCIKNGWVCDGNTLVACDANGAESSRHDCGKIRVCDLPSHSCLLSPNLVCAQPFQASLDSTSGLEMAESWLWSENVCAADSGLDSNGHYGPGSWLALDATVEKTADVIQLSVKSSGCSVLHISMDELPESILIEEDSECKYRTLIFEDLYSVPSVSYIYSDGKVTIRLWNSNGYCNIADFKVTTCTLQD